MSLGAFIGFRLSEKDMEMERLIKDTAEAEGRSMSWVVREIIRQYYSGGNSR